MKHKFTLLPINGGAFSCRPSFEVELDSEKILANDVILPGEFNPHNIRLWVIGNEFGALFALWAGNEQDALDEAVDKNLMGSFAVSKTDFAAMDEEEQEECDSLGNAGEPFNLDYAWLQVVRMDLAVLDDVKLALAFAEARGACADNLYR